MQRLGVETIEYGKAKNAWGELSETLRKSQNFYHVAVDVLTEKGRTVDDRVALLDEIGARYFPSGENAGYYQRMRNQIEIDGSAHICASEMAHTFVRFGVPCNYGLVGYVAENLPELQSTGKVNVTPAVQSEIKKITELAAKVSVGN